MRITLKPLSQPELGEIVMRDDLFAVGCNEAPFSALPAAAAVGLSANHAKLFRQQDSLYVVDLGSRGGTSVNGKAVHRRAVAIGNGDEVCFAGQFCFRIEISEQKWPGPGYEPLTLVLMPAGEGAPIEPIAIDHFPFLIGKDGGVFADYKTRFPDQSRYISRRHALIFRRQGSLYVEDLGSTNGTFLDGQRVATGTRLEDRASIAFGGEFFSYRIALDQDRAEALSQAPGTIFVTAADSFLDAFCPQADVQVAADGRAGQAPVKTGRSPGLPRRAGPFGRLRVLLAELRIAFVDDEPGRPQRRWGWFLLAGGLLVVALALGLYLKDSPERALHELMAAGRYADSAAMADRYLEAHPGNERIGLLGTESLVKHVVPAWMARLGKGDFDAAAQILKPAASLSRFNDDGLKMLALLEWAGRMERFMAKRGGPQAPLVIFHDEQPISDLVGWWEADARAHRDRLTRLMDYVPEFRPLGVRLTSHLVSLQNERSTYLHAIAELAQNIRAHLVADHANELASVLRTFQERYPR
ncbi:MAG TPA: FHA domain-containing protein, partial [Nitrococcus sp.]|nr:FHA domain-containing protein [Nitrococcus sp.]